MYNAYLSSQIFNHLMNGKVINKTKLNNNSQFVENPLFIEIIENLDDYKTQYQMNGVDLVVTVDYVYIKERGLKNDNLKTDITMKTCLLLLLLGKYITENNFRMSKLTEPSGGITEADIDAIMEMSDTPEILEKAKMKNDLLPLIKSILVKRSILLEKPGAQSYILSDSGRAFYDEIIKSYQS